MDLNELTEKMVQRVKNLSQYLVDDDYTNAIEDALEELGWTLPVTDTFKTLWIKKRTYRHLIFYLYTESAAKFKFEQISLNQRFEHYGDILKKIDEEYTQAKEEFMNEFEDIDPSKMFTTYVPSGFQYDDLGRDVTNYTNRQEE